MIINPIKTLRNAYILRSNPISPVLWASTVTQLPLLSTLNTKDLKKLKKLTTLFLYEKTFTGVKGFKFDDEKRLIIAVQACLLILHMDMSYYDGWVEVVVYPDTFVVYRNVTDNFGLVHDTSSALSGEAWSKGPVILAWTDVERESFAIQQGHNVIIHEFSHKLDMLNGRANGMPPLHPSMHRQEWTDSLSHAYDQLLNNIENYQHTTINEYAATNPAEFFAVSSEYFFTAPSVLKECCPDVFKQLKLFYEKY
ncbi:MAG: M90 family metallopeptidase [Cocleimonas sp.]